MAALNETNPTLLDLAKLTGPDGSIMDVVELLMETNEILDDMTWQEGNLVTGERVTVRTGLPTPTWRKIGGGVVPNKGNTAQVDFATGMLEAYSEIDYKLVKLAKDPAAFRLREDRAHIEGINQELADTLFFGNERTEPEAFTGLAPFYNSLTGSESSDNVIDGGGTGSDNASIWLVCWSPQTVYGVVPRGSQAGVQVEDKGRVTLEDASSGSNTGRMEALRTHYSLDAGLALKDWRYVVRIANIDKSNLTKDASSGADLPDLMFQAMDLIPNMRMGRCVFYTSRDLRTWIRRQATNAVSASTLTVDNIGGTPLMRFHEVPLRRCDALAADEAALT